jgi:DNA-binding IclR family transcriptional regulator
VALPYGRLPWQPGKTARRVVKRQVKEIAQRVGAHGPALYRVLRALGDVGVVAELENRYFTLTRLGAVLQ